MSYFRAYILNHKYLTKIAPTYFQEHVPVDFQFWQQFLHHNDLKARHEHGNAMHHKEALVRPKLCRFRPKTHLLAYHID